MLISCFKRKSPFKTEIGSVAPTTGYLADGRNKHKLEGLTESQRSSEFSTTSLTKLDMSTGPVNAAPACAELPKEPDDQNGTTARELALDTSPHFVFARLKSNEVSDGREIVSKPMSLRVETESSPVVKRRKFSTDNDDDDEDVGADEIERQKARFRDNQADISRILAEQSQFAADAWNSWRRERSRAEVLEREVTALTRRYKEELQAKDDELGAKERNLLEVTNRKSELEACCKDIASKTSELQKQSAAITSFEAKIACLQKTLTESRKKNEVMTVELKQKDAVIMDMSAGNRSLVKKLTSARRQLDESEMRKKVLRMESELAGSREKTKDLASRLQLVRAEAQDFTSKLQSETAEKDAIVARCDELQKITAGMKSQLRTNDEELKKVKEEMAKLVAQNEDLQEKAVVMEVKMKFTTATKEAFEKQCDEQKQKLVQMQEKQEVSDALIAHLKTKRQAVVGSGDSDNDGGDGDDSKMEVYCVCRSPDDGSRFMICCDHCEEWFHGDCVQITERKARLIRRYYCAECREKNPSLVIVRKVRAESEAAAGTTSDPPASTKDTTDKSGDMSEERLCHRSTT